MGYCLGGGGGGKCPGRILRVCVLGVTGGKNRDKPRYVRGVSVHGVRVRVQGYVLERGGGGRHSIYVQGEGDCPVIQTVMVYLFHLIDEIPARVSGFPTAKHVPETESGERR